MSYIVSDTTSNLPGFRYIFKLEVGGEIISTTKLYPTPTGTGVFNPSYILRNYVKNTFTNDISIPTIPTGLAIEYELTIYTEHQTQEETLKATYNKNIWEYSADWEEGKSLNSVYENFQPDDSVTPNLVEFLGPKMYVPVQFNSGGNIVTSDKFYDIRPLEKRTITAVVKRTDGTSPIERIVILSIQKDPDPLDPYKIWQIPYTPSTSTLPNANFLNLPVGIAALNQGITTPGTIANIPMGRSSFITPSEDDRYVVYFSQTGLLEFQSFPIGFKIRECGKYDRFSVLYKSTTGGWWSIPFTMKHYKSVVITKENREVFLPYNYGNDDASIKVLNTDAYGSWILNTDWLRYQEEVDEVMDMIKSPEIFILDELTGAVRYTPVVIENGSFDEYERNQEGLIRYTINFKEAFRKNSL